MTTNISLAWLRRRLTRFTPSTALWIGLGLYVLMAAAHIGLGQHNADEGWYLYAAGRVWSGALPYRDFAFTQMPALPYLYGLPLALLGPSLYVGRLITLALGLLQVGAAVALARRYAGLRGAALTALLLGSFTYVIYFNTIVKTYALVSLLITLTFLALPPTAGRPWRWGLALACASLAAMVRLSAAAFWLPVLIYALWTVRGGWLARLALAGWAVALWLPALYLFTRDLDATQWNLLGYHFGQWQGASLVRQLAEIGLYRAPLILSGYAPHLALAGATTAVYLATNPRPRRLGQLGLMLLSLIIFAASHLSTGDWHIEYLVPAAAGAMPLLAIGVVRVWERAGSRELRVLWASLFAATLLTALTQNFPAFLDLKSSQPPVEEIRAVAQVVTDHTTPDDKLLTLSAMIVAVEARREVLPGLELAHFSIQPVSDARAQALHVLSPALLADNLEHEAARLVILTGRDRLLLEDLGIGPRVEAALGAHYTQLWVQTEFGQYADQLTIYECRACP